MGSNIQSKKNMQDQEIENKNSCASVFYKIINFFIYSTKIINFHITKNMCMKLTCNCCYLRILNLLIIYLQSLITKTPCFSEQVCL